MSYKLLEHGTILAKEGFENFILGFNGITEHKKNEQGTTINIKGGFIAVYIAHTSDIGTGNWSTVAPSLMHDVLSKTYAALNTLEIEHDGISLKLDHIAHYKSFRMRFNNEFGDLHYFRFRIKTPDHSHDLVPQWLNENVWQSYNSFNEPTKNPGAREDALPFLHQFVNVSNVSSRHLYWLSSYEGSNGTESVQACLPYYKNSITETLLSLHNNTFPQFTFDSRKVANGTLQDLSDQQFIYPSQATINHPIQFQSFITEGVFKHIALLHDLNILTDATKGIDSDANSHQFVFNFLLKVIQDATTYQGSTQANTKKIKRPLTLSGSTDLHLNNYTSRPLGQVLEIICLNGLNNNDADHPIDLVF